jgi:hypothetical protein
VKAIAVRDFVFVGVWALTLAGPLLLMGATFDQLRLVLALAALATLPSAVFTVWWVGRRGEKN